VEFMALRFAAFAALVIIGAFNREMTGVLLWFSFFAAYPHEWKWWLFMGIVLAAILIGLRLTVNAEPALHTTAWVLDANLNTWRTPDGILYQGLLAPLWVLLYHKMRGKPARMIMCVLIPYLLLVALFGIWQEVRLMMPVLILGIPFAKDVFDDK
jgi:hypothetical protein